MTKYIFQLAKRHIITANDTQFVHP